MLKERLHCGVLWWEGALTTNSTYQCGHSEDLNRQSDDGYAPLMVVIYEVLLQLFKVLKRQRRHVFSFQRVDRLQFSLV